MRLTLRYFGRPTRDEKKVPFKPILPIKLRDFVSGKGQRNESNNCLHEMSLLLTCLEENDFENQRCTKNIKLFQNCWDNYTKENKEAKLWQQKGIPTPNSKNLTHKQIGYFLKKYPTR